MPQFNYEGLSKEPGIYFIFNLMNRRVYVGSCKVFQVRWSQHLYSLRKGKHSNKFLQADFNKCGELAFEFHILEHLPSSSREQRLRAEEVWLKRYYDGGKQCYNLVNRAISREGFKASNPEETALKMSLIKTGKKHPPRTEETLQRLRESHTGLKQSKETIEKRRLACLGQKRAPHTEESKQKMRLAKLGKKKSEAHRLAMHGRIPWNKGLTSSEEVIEKMRISKIGFKHTEESKQKMHIALLGNTRNLGKKRHSFETREKMRLAHLGVSR